MEHSVIEALESSPHGLTALQLVPDLLDRLDEESHLLPHPDHLLVIGFQLGETVASLDVCGLERRDIGQHHMALSPPATRLQGSK